MDFVTPRTHPPGLLDRWLKEMTASLLVVGHTHKPMLHRSEHGLVINPGSVISAPVVSTSEVAIGSDVSPTPGTDSRRPTASTGSGSPSPRPGPSDLFEAPWPRRFRS
jgi:hypothetical protein